MDLHLNPFSGISGDMFLGVLLDLGLSFSALQNEFCPALHLEEEVVLNRRSVNYHGIEATNLEVKVREQEDHRHLPEIHEIIGQSGLSESVKVRALQCFQHLAEAEAQVHGTTPEEIHFHEVGALDAIVDICGVFWGLEALKIERVTSEAVALGSGFVHCAHGKMPVPVPAVCLLLQNVPTLPSSIPFELTTPTGAALLKTCCSAFKTPSPFYFDRVGYGAGQRELEEIPNLLRGYLSQSQEKSEGRETILVLETQLDDLNPQVVAYVMERLFTAGALDVFVTPIYMKKNRPAFLLSCLAPSVKEALLERILFEETSTLGIRRYEVERSILKRHWEEVETCYGLARVKIGTQGLEERVVNPEYEDCKALAEKAGVPLKEVFAEVLSVYRSIKKS